MSIVFKKIVRNTLIVLAFIVISFFLIGTWYQKTYSMDIAATMEVNDPMLDSKVLIATQGSRFKDKVVAGVVEKLKSRQVFIKVIDVRDLKNIEPDDWTVIVIIHTWEMGKAPKSVSTFAARAKNSGLITLTTSGDGRSHLEGIDGITSASKIEDVNRCVTEIVNRVGEKLELEYP